MDAYESSNYLFMNIYRYKHRDRKHHHHWLVFSFYKFRISSCTDRSSSVCERWRLSASLQWITKICLMCRLMDKYRNFVSSRVKLSCRSFSLYRTSVPRRFLRTCSLKLAFQPGLAVPTENSKRRRKRF